MARAKRHYIPDQVWHITQRCHKRDFLLKFKQDSHRWNQWLFEAKRRFGLVVLNYVVTLNHVHSRPTNENFHFKGLDNYLRCVGSCSERYI